MPVWAAQREIAMLLLLLAATVSQDTLLSRFEKERMEAKPYVEQVRVMAPLPRRLTTDAEKAEIALLIKALAEIKDPDVGISPGMSGRAFAPVEPLNEFGSGILMYHGHKRNEALVKLVAFGPKAIPQLLDALDDATPTRLTLEHGGCFGYMDYCERFLARTAKALKWKEYWEAPGMRDEVTLYQPREAEMILKAMAALPAEPPKRDRAWGHLDKYTVTVGDACYLALGQIVNRGYAPSQYQPTAITCLSSTKHDKQLVADVRTRWRVKDIDREVFETLMLDFLYRDDRGAAVRLGFYYPKQAEPLLLDSLRKAVAGAGGEEDKDYEITRKVEAYAAIPIPNVRAACWAFARDAQSVYHFLAGLAAAPKTDDPLIVRRLEAFFDVAFAGHQDLLKRYEMEAVWREALKRFGNAEFLRKQFERAAKVDEEETRISVCESIPGEWAKDLLAPFLKDTRKLTRWSDGTRMCDLAAAAIKHADQSLHFDADAETAARDQQIEVLYRHCTGQGVRREPKREPASAKKP